MLKNKAKSVKAIVKSSPHKNIAHIHQLHRRISATNKPATKNAANFKNGMVEAEEIRQEYYEAEVVAMQAYKEPLPEIISTLDIFLTSLRNFNQDDVIPDKESGSKKKKNENLIVNLMLVICVSVFIFSGYKLIEKNISYSEAAESYDGIRDLFYEEAEDAGSEFTKLQKSRRNHYSVELLKKMEAPDEVEEQEVYDDYEVAEVSEMDKMKYSLQALAAKNSDTYGWINISELNIDYPVVQTTDNEYYLKHNFYKVYHESGAIFTDFRVNKNVHTNKNTIIYGHNMADNTMFQNLLKYRYSKDLMERSVIELSTMDGIFVYKIFSVYVTDKYYPYIKVNEEFSSDEEWLQFLSDIHGRSIHKTEIEFKPDDKIITLSTCTNSWDNRFAVHAVLIEVRQ